MRRSRPDKMNIAQAAKALGMSVEKLSAELQRDAKRPIRERHYPFANPIRNDKTGTWTYDIETAKLEAYRNPQTTIDYVLLADMVASRVLDKLQDTTAQTT